MKKLLLPLFLFIALLAGCAQGTTELAPPDIRYGEDVCVECNMIISDERFAAAVAHEVGPGRYETASFDDIGDMLEYAAKNTDKPPVAWYVHDYETKEWTDATTASYVASDRVETPMASGLMAFARRDRGDVMAYALGVPIMDWQALQAQFAAGQIGPGSMPAAHGGGGMPAMPAAASPDALAGDQHDVMSGQEFILGEMDVDGYQLQVVSHGPLHAGYNAVMAHLTNPTGQPVSGATITYKPLMAMKDGMNHAAPVEQPVEEAPGMYRGAVGFSMPDGPDLGDWTLAVSFNDPANNASGEGNFVIDVAPSKLISSFEASDGSKVFVMVVEPSEPVVGKQPFEVFVAQKKGMMDWPALDGLTLEITPEMPTMGHGSPGNENPVATGDGHYAGLVNFTMAGPWKITVALSSEAGTLGEAVLEYAVQ